MSTRVLVRRSMFPEDSAQYHAQILDHGPLRSSMYKGLKDLYNYARFIDRRGSMRLMTAIRVKDFPCCQLRVHGAVH